MKKLFIVLSLPLITLVIHAQSGGSGTLGDPYWGDISTSVGWSVGTYPGNTVYIGTPSNPDFRVITNGHLTIGPGMTIVCKELVTDLIITGTGILSAGGTGTSVLFTKDASKSYWGHISFESMDVSAAASSINNCIIEYGDVRSNSGSAKFGGGIYADFSNLIIKNSVIQHNKAEWGGGIFVSEDKYPGIENCYIYNNFSKEGGGGIYLWNRASSEIKNCIFQENHCDGTTFNFYTGGGLGSQSSGSIKALNCTFINNTSSRTSGQSIMLYSSISNMIKNCLIWGNTGNHFYLTGTNTIQYTAVQGSAPSGTGNFVLSATNNDASGPNFTDPSSSDWSIKFISPCRDAGTSSNTPLTDYLGKGRVGNYDIGAYEVQYSRWTGTTNTDWTTATNWDQSVTPSVGTGDVIIPKGLLLNYPISSTPDFTIGANKFMILEPEAKATFGTLTNSGTLKLEANADSVSSLIVSNYSGNNATVELYLTGKETSGINKWHYISTPVSSLSTNVFTSTTGDLAQYVESLPTSSNEGLVEGWIAYDGYNYVDRMIPDPALFTFSSLTIGQGYNYFHTTNFKYTFSGTPNTSDVTMSLGYSGAPSLHGFNLLGNPFSSGLNWNDIINSISIPFPENTSQGIYFTRGNTQCTYIGGVGIPEDVNGIIPPMQGFFTKTYSTGNTITLAAAARTHNKIHSRYKGATTIPLVRLSITEEPFFDETVVRFDNQAKSYLDYDFDAVKMFIPTTDPSIYSFVSGTKYAINGQPFPDSNLEIPIVVNLITGGNHTISSKQLQGLENYNIYLIDNVTGFTANLKTTPALTFSASSGLITDRFILKISNALTGTEDPILPKNIFNIFQRNDFINIQTLSDEWDGKKGSIKILDLSGKTISDLKNSEFSKNSLIQVLAPTVKGLYMVELRSGVKRFVEKVIIK